MFLNSKKAKIFVKTIACLLLMFLIPQFISFAQQGNPREMDAGYYIIVAAYSASKESYAQRYMKQLKEQGREADYGYSSKKNMYFVYLDYEQDFQTSINKMRNTRSNTSFSDAWVFVCKGGSKNITSTSSDSESDDTDRTDNSATVADNNNNDVEKEADGVAAADNGKDGDNTSMKDRESGNESDSEDADDIAEADDQISEEDKQKEDSEEESNRVKTGTLEDYRLYVNMENARNNDKVEGKVEVIDVERAKLMKTIHSGEFAEIPDPKNGTGKMSLIADVFGYRKNQVNLNYYNPLSDTTTNNIEVTSDIYKVNFDMVRYHKGDIVVMYNVYYFNDAAIMQPESRYEVNSLLSMMKENQNYKIRIHGHTNGKNPGKIVTRGESNSFFALSDLNKDGYGSAKELSKERAQVIKDYLVSEGISEDRMEIKAWGGKRMLYDKFSSQAKNNVRVEIEILEE